MNQKNFKKSAIISSIIVMVTFAMVEQFVTDCYLPSICADHQFLSVGLPLALLLLGLILVVIVIRGRF